MNRASRVVVPPLQQGATMANIGCPVNLPRGPRGQAATARAGRASRPPAHHRDRSARAPKQGPCGCHPPRSRYPSNTASHPADRSASSCRARLCSSVPRRAQREIFPTFENGAWTVERFNGLHPRLDSNQEPVENFCSWWPSPRQWATRKPWKRNSGCQPQMIGERWIPKQHAKNCMTAPTGARACE
jgi:hypothetical protein